MNILIIGPSWVGDMVMAQTLFQCLRQRHPGCQIDVLAPEWSRPILERMPEVRAALSFPFGHGGSTSPGAAGSASRWPASTTRRSSCPTR